MLTYGHEVNSMDDPFVSISKKGSEQLVLAMKAGGYLVDSIPWLKYVPKWFPGASFQTIAAYGAKLSRDMRFLPYFDARDKFFSGAPIPSFLSLQIEERIDANGKLSEEDEGIISAACGICYSAGADTTSTSLLFFVLAMGLHPEVQTLAHDEVDRIVGGGRLPEIADRPQLPYCSALCKELHRWNPIVPNGIAHLTKEDDEYAGFFIPAKTMILPNQWAMLMDPKEYPDPDVFRPERFLPTDGGRVQRDPYKIAFGFGRRVCPGRNFADNAVFLVIVQILATFDISKSRNADGAAVDPVVNIKCEGVLRIPERFECSIQPRSSAATTLIPME